MRQVPGTRLLCGGFWGLSRHVNYLGEVLQAVALALPGSLVASEESVYYRVLPWLYPLYYVALFIPRQMDDDDQIEAKHGSAAFHEYCRRVPYRIVPGDAPGVVTADEVLTRRLQPGPSHAPPPARA